MDAFTANLAELGELQVKHARNRITVLENLIDQMEKDTWDISFWIWHYDKPKMIWLVEKKLFSDWLNFAYFRNVVINLRNTVDTQIRRPQIKNVSY